MLKETIENTRSITLSYLQDVVTLEFSALDFTAPQQNKYHYKLVGIDKEWVESGTRRAATYVHLPAGNYTFKVQGNNKLLVRIKKLLEMRRNLQQYYLKKAGIHRVSLTEHMIIPGKINAQDVEDGFVKRVREAVEQNLTDVNFTVEKLSQINLFTTSYLS